MAATRHSIPWDTAGQRISFNADAWELYHLEKDFSQATDVAAQNPQKLKELQVVFDVEARKYNVYPLDDRFTQRFDLSLRPNALTGVTSFTYGPGVGYISESSFINTHNVPFSITAEVEAETGAAEGVIAAIGGGTSGWSLYVKDGRPTFYYNFFDVAGYRVQSSTQLPRGKSTVRVEITPEEAGYGKPAAVKLLIDGNQVAAGRVERTVPVGYGAEGFDVGKDNISAVSPDYKAPFAFSGKIRGVTIAIQK
jgi:arylsulfatase